MYVPCIEIPDTQSDYARDAGDPVQRTLDMKETQFPYPSILAHFIPMAPTGREREHARASSPYQARHSGSQRLADRIEGAQLSQEELLSIIRMLLSACTRLEEEIRREQREIDKDIRRVQQDIDGFRRDMGLQPPVSEAQDSNICPPIPTLTVSAPNDTEGVSEGVSTVERRAPSLRLRDSNPRRSERLWKAARKLTRRNVQKLDEGMKKRRSFSTSRDLCASFPLSVIESCCDILYSGAHRPYMRAITAYSAERVSLAINGLMGSLRHIDVSALPVSTKPVDDLWFTEVHHSRLLSLNSHIPMSTLEALHSQIPEIVRTEATARINQEVQGYTEGEFKAKAHEIGEIGENTEEGGEESESIDTHAPNSARYSPAIENESGNFSQSIRPLDPRQLALRLHQMSLFSPSTPHRSIRERSTPFPYTSFVKSSDVGGGVAHAKMPQTVHAPTPPKESNEKSPSPETINALPSPDNASDLQLLTHCRHQMGLIPPPAPFRSIRERSTPFPYTKFMRSRDLECSTPQAQMPQTVDTLTSPKESGGPCSHVRNNSTVSGTDGNFTPKASRAIDTPPNTEVQGRTGLRPRGALKLTERGQKVYRR
ncbi:hypothetical protein NMY22_g13992 [Coprinellus aureogranulatus]|nr:hypothetical protein NMY22_g13992 [Coprinellus aureogranulatus]